MTVHRDRLLMNETNRCTIIFQLFISGNNSCTCFGQTDKIHNIHITNIFRWAASIPWVHTKMNCYSSHNYKQYSSTSNNCCINLINYSVLLSKNFLLKIYDPKHRAKMKYKIPQKHLNQKY